MKKYGYITKKPHPFDHTRTENKKSSSDKEDLIAIEVTIS